MDTLPLLLMSPLLVAAAIADLRRMHIPNKLSWAGLALFAVCWLFMPWDEMVLRTAGAALVFVIGFILFALRIIAAGDLKILSVLTLFIPVHSLALFGFVFSACLMSSILILVAMRRVPRAVGPNWVSMRAHGTLPMGLSIATAGITQLTLLKLIKLKTCVQI